MSTGRGATLAGVDAHLTLRKWSAGIHMQHLGDAKQVLLANVAKTVVEELEGGRRSGDGENMLWDLSGDVLNIELHEKKPIVRSRPEDGLAVHWSWSRQLESLMMASLSSLMRVGMEKRFLVRLGM